MQDKPDDNIPVLEDLIENDQLDKTDVKIPEKARTADGIDLIDPEPTLNNPGMVDMFDPDPDPTPVRMQEFSTDIEIEDLPDIDIDKVTDAELEDITDVGLLEQDENDEETEMNPYLNQKIYTILQKHMDKAYQEIIEMLELE